ncbi:MAG: hypothetical protein CMF62_03100 [Magnetococcales bacterium]|nr:hypothetical protein [Magnetococcales bacterium]|tara:strand:+ start:30325 stop:30645 length:321 start_codon:yes stop_codon:yes gene_type:complete
MSINKAYIDVDATWRNMTLDEVNSIDNFDCSDTLKDKIKTFLKEKIQAGYLFTDDIECTEVDYDGFEYFVAYKKKYDSYEEIKTWYEYDNDGNDNLNDLFGNDDEW